MAENEKENVNDMGKSPGCCPTGLPYRLEPKAFVVGRVGRRNEKRTFKETRE